MNCLICKSKDKVIFQDDYKLEIKADYEVFKDVKLYKCQECEFSFAYPMPNETTLNNFYENIYRSDGRPPYLVGENIEEQKKHFLDDKNLSYLLYVTSLIDVSKIKSLYDFGGGDGDFGYALKKRFPDLKLYCTEHDKHCKKILSDRDYNNIKDFSQISEKFDMIVALHSLEHLTEINSIFKKFSEILSDSGYIFFEVPNCEKEYWNGRPYDSPHLLFYTKKSFEKLANIHNLEFINFSFSSYSFLKDQEYQRNSQKSYYKEKESFFKIHKIKKILKKILPYAAIKLRQDFIKIKNLDSEDRLNWFINNSGDNCYIRGILKKK